MRARCVTAFVVALPTVLGLGACGNDGGSAPTGEAIRVVGTEMAFSPEALTVSEGRHRVVFANQGAVYHELAVIAPGGEVLGARSIPAGETASFDVVLDGAGSYRLVCREPGHTEAGMVGTLTVTG